MLVFACSHAILNAVFCQQMTKFWFKNAKMDVLMIVNFSLSNAFSFKDAQNLSMLAVSSPKDDINQANVMSIKGERILKSALIFGANASGKSNFIKTICFTVGYSTKSMPGIKRYRLSLRAGGCHTPRQVSGRHTPHFSMD